MDAEALKAMQAPLKQRYRDTPEDAVITLKASGEIGEGLSCSVQTSKALVEAGLHPATGGSGLQACSGDMLLEALVAWLSVPYEPTVTLALASARRRWNPQAPDLDLVLGLLGAELDEPDRQVAADEARAPCDDDQACSFRPASGPLTHGGPTSQAVPAAGPCTP